MEFSMYTVYTLNWKPSGPPSMYGKEGHPREALDWFFLSILDA